MIRPFLTLVVIFLAIETLGTLIFTATGGLTGFELAVLLVAGVSAVLALRKPVHAHFDGRRPHVRPVAGQRP